MNNFDIITTTDKAKRDQMFEDLRKNGNHLERQVVKFSSVEVRYNMNGFAKGYQSNWSVAYPRT